MPETTQFVVYNILNTINSIYFYISLYLLFIYIFIYIYLFICILYINIYIYIYIHTYIHIYIYIYIVGFELKAESQPGLYFVEKLIRFNARHLNWYAFKEASMKLLFS